MKKSPGLKEFKQATSIASAMEICCLFAWTDECSETDCENREIIIDLDETADIRHFWSIFFHEIAHMWCYDNGKYRVYHEDALPKKELAIYMRRMGLKIERYVDYIGSLFMKEYFPNLRFKRSYRSKNDIAWYREWLDKTYPLED